jgi:hypothetical protein
MQCPGEHSPTTISWKKHIRCSHAVNRARSVKGIHGLSGSTAMIPETTKMKREIFHVGFPKAERLPFGRPRKSDPSRLVSRGSDNAADI